MNLGIRRIAVAAAAAAFSFGLFGCAIGNTYRYSESIGVLQAAGRTRVAVCVHDRRPAAVSGEIQSHVVGSLRGFYYNKLAAYTASGSPLSEDMSRAIANSLKKRGFDAVAVKTSPADSPEEAQKKIEMAGAQRSILVDLNEWSSETFLRTAMNYNVKIVVRNEGEERRKAENNQSGRENLGMSLWTPARHSREAVPEFFKRKIEEWLNDPAAIEILP